MLPVLDATLQLLPELVKDESRWTSLVINRRKPYTYRAFTQLGDVRVCLHRFEGCDPHESFYHPHPWPGAFAILQGSYAMNLGYSVDRESKPNDVARIILPEGARYEITNPMTWHTVEPLTDVVYTVMVNGPAWKIAHSEVRTTKGKDLQSMTPKQLKEHLAAFSYLTRL
jgi:hypothetical protein